MKKLLSIIFIFTLTMTLMGCSHGEAVQDLQDDYKADELLTDDELDELEKADPDFQEDYLEALGEATKENRIEEDIKLTIELEDLEDKKKVGEKSKGSCDTIAENSVCLEYYGSFWTRQITEMSCEGTYSTGPCPEGMSGGCNTGVGTQADMVAWMYLSGGGEMTASSMGNAKNACDATMASKWIMSK